MRSSVQKRSESKLNFPFFPKKGEGGNEEKHTPHHSRSGFLKEGRPDDEDDRSTKYVFQSCGKKAGTFLRPQIAMNALVGGREKSEKELVSKKKDFEEYMENRPRAFILYGRQSKGPFVHCKKERLVFTALSREKCVPQRQERTDNKNDAADRSWLYNDTKESEVL